MFRTIWLFIFLLLFSLSARADSNAWILVDTTQLYLQVMQDDTPQLTLKNIAIGRFGASRSRMKGDNQTPIGTFHINWIKPHSRFYRFYGIDFPNKEVADLALTEGRISRQTWETIIRTIDTTGTPPQNTPLGGYIGIHGIGKGDEAVHARYNWTNGCIALTNTQIDQLAPWIRQGIKVVIR